MASDPEKVVAWAQQIAPEIVYFDLDVFPLSGEYQAKLTMGGTRRSFRMASMDADRSLVQALGIGTPVDFREEPLAAAGRGRKQKELAAEFNRDRVRWVSQVELRPGEPYLLRIPAERQDAGFGSLCVWFEWTGELGGGSMSKHLPIGLGDPREARRMMDRWHLDRHRHENFVGPLPERAAMGGYGTCRAATTPFAGGRLPPRRKAGEG
jgi:hypothetical protein